MPFVYVPQAFRRSGNYAIRCFFSDSQTWLTTISVRTENFSILNTVSETLADSTGWLAFFFF